MLDSLLANEAFINAVTTVLGALITGALGYVAILINKVVKDDKKTKKITGIAEEAVWEVYEDMVKDWKAKAADGKLTADERKEALVAAQSKLMTKARKDGIDVVREVGQAGVRRMIENTIQKFKGGQSPNKKGK